MPVDFLLVVGFVVAASLGLVLVRKRVPLELLLEHHEVAGVCFAVVGGFYGIILAFVLVSSWERYETARAQTEVEAGAAADLYRHADGLSEPTRSRLKGAVLGYMQSVLDDEWESMADGQPSDVTQKYYVEIWNSIIQSKPTESWEVALAQSTLDKLDDLADARRYRIICLNSGLPDVIWLFLVVFGVATVAFTYLFGMRRLAPQIVITVVLASTIAWSLALVYEAQTPFSGELRVGSRAFRIALELLQKGTPQGGSMRDLDTGSE